MLARGRIPRGPRGLGEGPRGRPLLEGGGWGCSLPGGRRGPLLSEGGWRACIARCRAMLTHGRAACDYIPNPPRQSPFCGGGWGGGGGGGCRVHSPMRGGVAGGSSVRLGRETRWRPLGSWAPSRKNLGFAGGDSAIGIAGIMGGITGMTGGITGITGGITGITGGITGITGGITGITGGITGITGVITGITGGITGITGGITGITVGITGITGGITGVTGGITGITGGITGITGGITGCCCCCCEGTQHVPAGEIARHALFGQGAREQSAGVTLAGRVPTTTGGGGGAPWCGGGGVRAHGGGRSHLCVLPWSPPPLRGGG